ncbi:MAG: TadE/TadG family type IV pilus assembly protein [Xanthobacteraceae bacterium]
MARMRRAGILRAIRRFAREHRGVSVVEFALLLPVMLTVYLGGTEVTQGITIKRKTTIVTRAIGDLVAQDVSITNAEMTAILAAATSIVAPYSASNLKIVVSSVTIDGNNVAKITWSDASTGATARTLDTTVTLPPGLNQFPNTTLIWAEAEYTYTPPVGYMITGSMTLKDQLYLRPRLVNSIARVP